MNQLSSLDITAWPYIQQNLERTTAFQQSIQEKKNSELFVIVWLDENVRELADNKANTEQLGCIVNHLELFDNEEECYIFIEELQEKKVFLIVSGTLGEHFVPRISSFSQVVLIYIFCKDVARHDKWAKTHSKIRGVYSVFAKITERLCCDSKFLLGCIDCIELTSTSPAGASASQIHRQEPSFMYAQFLRDILVNFESSLESKQEMIDFCRQRYVDNSAQLKIIEEFEIGYVKENAIWWYTKSCFLYKLLNQALRLQDVGILYHLRYYIRDLHEQIAQRHIEFQNAERRLTSLTVYRGLLMPIEDFKKLRENVGGFMSVMSFLSTSKDRNVASTFAGQSNADSAVLFTINIDLLYCTTPFTDTRDQSQFEEEQEILFTMGAVFRICSVIPSDSDIWMITLSLTGEEDPELLCLGRNMRQYIIFGENSLNDLATLMLHMGRYTEAQNYYHLLLEDKNFTTTFRHLAYVYNQLGYVYNHLGQTEKAIEQYERSLGVYLLHNTQCSPEISTTYSNLGAIYLKTDDLEKALQYFNKALSSELISVDPHYMKVGSFYSNMGSIYCQSHRYTEALEIYKNSLELWQNTLPANHPNIAHCCYNISEVYCCLDDNKNAIEWLYKTLDLQLNSLPASHPDLARTYYSLGKYFYGQEKWVDALAYMKKSYAIYSNNFPQDHPDVIKTENDVNYLEWLVQNRWFQILYKAIHFYPSLKRRKTQTIKPRIREI